MLKIKVDEEITLVKIRMKSAPVIYKSIENSREFLREWLSWIDQTKKVDDTRRFISMVNKSTCLKTDMVFEIWIKEDFAGLIALKEIDNSNKKAEIGYWLVHKYLGKGIMQRSCKAIIKYAFLELGMNKIHIKCSVDNIRSCNVPRQLQFTYEGIEREGEILHNRFVDLKIYSLLRKEWVRINAIEKNNG